MGHFVNTNQGGVGQAPLPLKTSSLCDSDTITKYVGDIASTLQRVSGQLANAEQALFGTPCEGCTTGKAPSSILDVLEDIRQDAIDLEARLDSLNARISG